VNSTPTGYEPQAPTPMPRVVRVDHGRAHVLVAQQLLDGADVVAGFEQMGGERVPQRVTPCVLRDTRATDRLLHGALNDRGVHVMAALLARDLIDPTHLLREHPLPAPLGGRVGALARQGVGHDHATPPRGQIPVVNHLHAPQVLLERFVQ
jgi:hypothetical protein